VLPDPEVTNGEVPAAAVPPKIFQFPAVGDKAPPESPVIVLPTEVPPSTVKSKY